MGLVRFIITLVIIYIAYKMIKGLFLSRNSSAKRKVASGGEYLVEDPHCHTYVPLSNACKVSYEGKTLYFCSKKCLEEFKKKDKKSVNQEAS